MIAVGMTLWSTERMRCDVIVFLEGCFVIVRGDAEQGSDPDLFDVVTQFESLGGMLQGCEFGLFQRSLGIENLGLLKWANVSPGTLLRALAHRFVGLGDPESTELHMIPTPQGIEYFTKDKNLELPMHTFVYEHEIPRHLMLDRVCKRLTFLRQKLIADLSDAQKLLVFKVTTRNLEESEVTPLCDALNEYRPNWLLYVCYASEGRPSGTAEVRRPGLIFGYIDRFSISASGEGLGPNHGEWQKICRAAWRAWQAAIREGAKKG